MDKLFFLQFPLDRIFILLFAFLIDIILGDPQRNFHPIIIIGKVIKFFENKLLKRGTRKKFMGLILLIVVSVIFTGAISLIIYYLNRFSPLTCFFISGIILYFFICSKSMIYHFNSIYKEIKYKNIQRSRSEVSKVVSRSTENMGFADLIRSSIESIAENTSDGLIAPLFYYLIGGIPMVVLYKVVNTLDSMVGYKNDKYYDFGFYSAKFDDILNYIPSRLTALLASLISFVVGGNFKNTIKTIKKYSNKHESPNSGFPESSFAGALGLRLGGINYYFNKKVYTPFIGKKKKEFEAGDIKKALKLSIISTLFFIAIIITIYIGIYFIIKGVK